jgi:UDPglucose 6-dehydrogenase
MSRRIAVIGTGYLGAVHATCMTDLDHGVVGVDVDVDKVEALSAGKPPFFEPGLDDQLGRALDSGRLRFTTDFAEIREAEVVFLCVGTPQRHGSDAADTRHLEAAVESIAPYLDESALVVGKSTVPVGTARRLRKRLRKFTGRRVRLAWNPEFLREGFAIEDTLSPDRLVYGVSDEGGDHDAALLDDVYAGPISRGVPRIVTDFATAELVKVAANAFLATKISFINAMAEVCEASGGDVVTLADAIGHDPRIGRKFLGAGLGFGGGCLPKDIRAFMARAGEIGAMEALTFLREVDAINLRRRSRTVDLAREACEDDLHGCTVAVLGAAFKPNSDDIRDSPALDVARMIQQEGATVRVHDPKAMAPAKAKYPDLEFAVSAEDACENADVVLHLTEWQEYREIDPDRLAVAAKVIIDGRNALDPEKWQSAGWSYRSLGRHG